MSFPLIHLICQNYITQQSYRTLSRRIKQSSLGPPDAESLMNFPPGGRNKSPFVGGLTRPVHTKKCLTTSERLSFIFYLAAVLVNKSC